MKASRFLAVTLATLALSGTALAQMGGGGHGGGMGGSGGGMGGSGNGMGPGSGMDPGAEMGQVLVAPDGKAVLVQRTTTTSGSTTTIATSVVAVGTNGTAAWTWTPPAALRQVALAPGLVVAALGPQDAASTTTQLAGLNLSSGTQAWAVSVDGMASHIEATTNGFLCIVTKMTVGGTGMPASVTRRLVAFNLSGNQVWSFSLN